MQQFADLFKKKGYENMWKRHIQWMSEPVKDKAKFLKKINGDLKNLY